MNAGAQIDRSLAAPTLAMLEFMESVGLRPADADLPLIADDNLHRFRVEGDKPGSKNGWYVLHADRNAIGVFGSWRTGEEYKWRVTGWQSLPEPEKAAQRLRVATAKARAAADQAKRNEVAANKAAWLWKESAPADAAHPYVTRKKIEPFGARHHGGRLVLPIRRLSDWALASLQFIDAHGRKRMLSDGAKRGHAIPVRVPGAPHRITVCEGWATGCTLAAMSPDDLVLAAIDAGNLKPVAQAIRECWSDLPLLIASDNDRKDPARNPGLEAARAATLATGANMIHPTFREGAPVGLSDFNDWFNAPEWQGGAE